MRAWARSKGYDVADRGRLPAEITDAYVAAHRKGGDSAKKKAPADKPTAKKPPTSGAADAAAETTPQPKPSPVADDRRLVALGEELAALTQRVAALEQAAGGKGNGKSGSKTPRFRRSK